jgi:hypothetical protein
MLVAQELYQGMEFLLNGVDSPAFLLDPFTTPCPIVGCTPGFSQLTGYTMDQLAGKNLGFMLHGVPTRAISKSAQKNMENFCQMCRMSDLAHIGEFVYVQVNARQCGEPFVNFCMMGLCRIGQRTLILGVAMCLCEGLSLCAPSKPVVETARNNFKATCERLLGNTQRCRADAKGTEATVDFDNKSLAAEPLGFFAERLQDHCLLTNSGRTAHRREPEQIPKNCLLFGDRPMQPSDCGLCFSVLINEVTHSFEGFPLLGFTKRMPKATEDIYPTVSKCLGSSVLIGGCGEAFARDKFDHFEMRFKQPAVEDLQQWAADASVPSNLRKPHVQLQPGDILCCRYSCSGHLTLERNGETMWEFDVERPIDGHAGYYPVVDVCFSACSLTMIPTEKKDLNSRAIDDVVCWVRQKYRGQMSECPTGAGLTLDSLPNITDLTDITDTDDCSSLGGWVSEDIGERDSLAEQEIGLGHTASRVLPEPCEAHSTIFDLGVITHGMSMLSVLMGYFCEVHRTKEA